MLYPCLKRNQSKIFPSSKQPVLEFKGGPTFCSKIPKSTKKKTQIPTFYKGVFGLMNPGRSPFACMKPLFEFFFSKTILQSLEWKIQRDLYITLSAMHACYNPTKPTRVTIKKAGSKSTAAARGKKASGWVDGGVEWSLRWRRLRE